MGEPIKRKITFDQAIAYSVDLYDKKKYTKAEKVLVQLLVQSPNNPRIHNLLGNVYWGIGYSEKAIGQYKKAIQSFPEFAEAYHNLGNVLKDIGQFKNAEIYFRKALEINPLLAETYRIITVCKKYTSKDDPDIENIHSLLKHKTLTKIDKSQLNFALGKIYDDLKEYDEAFYCYNLGNNLKLNKSKSDLRTLHEFIYKSISTFDKEFFASNPNSQNDSSLPIFLVGMPRSGTTLLEQILSAHPKVVSAGEIGAIELLVKEQQIEVGKPTALFDVLEFAKENELAQQAEKYLALLHNQFSTTGTKYVLNKMPANFIYLGFISRLFPNTKIIHCVRDKMDTCLSNYLTYFASGNEQSYHLTTLGKYYMEYEKIMSHWSKNLPVKIIDVEYEKLVSNSEHEIRNILEYLDLEWEESCILFNKQKTNIKTASTWQARQPINTRSVKRWKNYEKHLKPLIKLFNLEDV
ncbi:MAG: tetratricopeptide repeat protein [Ignavibacteriae bacterium]|nr:tetratricopeptide repeat protein [Ignavibacteriota bacterium]